MQTQPQTKKKHSSLKRVRHSIKKDDVSIIREHLYQMDNEAIKNALIANGVYDKKMQLTATYR